MPYLVEQLIQDRPKPVTISSSTPVTEALRFMLEYDYSQLPVVVEDDKPIGLLTYEGIIRGIRNFKASIDDLNVRDVMVTAPLFNQEDDLFDLLEKLKLTNAVLIVNHLSNLIGIVTGYDSTEYFRSRAEDMMRVEDIEMMIKDLILAAYTLDNEEIDNPQLAKAIAKFTYQEGDNSQGKLKAFDDLTLNEYINLLLYQKTWPFFEPIFKKSSKHIRGLLNDIRSIRNALAHFRSDISPEQAAQLRFCSEWLSRCKDEYDRALRQSKGAQPSSNTYVEIETSSRRTDTSAPQDQEQHAVELIAEEVTPTDSRYAPVADWLASQPSAVDQVDLRFSDIEQMIGSELPLSARKHPAWWANDSSSAQRHSRVWLDVGWRRNKLSITQETVSFARIREREKAYIDFFSAARARLKEKANFPIREGSPGGGSWDTWQTLTTRTPIPGIFAMSFARGQRFRVELYIDTGKKECSKRIFDRIHAQQAFLESQLGAISWERIDNKRACRIAIYHDGQITDDPRTLDTLQEWAVETAMAFYQAISSMAEQATIEVLNSCP